MIQTTLERRGHQNYFNHPWEINNDLSYSSIHASKKISTILGGGD
jgi:hypothetical protein